MVITTTLPVHFFLLSSWDIIMEPGPKLEKPLLYHLTRSQMFRVSKPSWHRPIPAAHSNKWLMHPFKGTHTLQSFPSLLFHPVVLHPWSKHTALRPSSSRSPWMCHCMMADWMAKLKAAPPLPVPRQNPKAGLGTNQTVALSLKAGMEISDQVRPIRLSLRTSRGSTSNMNTLSIYSSNNGIPIPALTLQCHPLPLLHPHP